MILYEQYGYKKLFFNKASLASKTTEAILSSLSFKVWKEAKAAKNENKIVGT